MDEALSDEDGLDFRTSNMLMVAMRLDASVCAGGGGGARDGLEKCSGHSCTRHRERAGATSATPLGGRHTSACCAALRHCLRGCMGLWGRGGGGPAKCDTHLGHLGRNLGHLGRNLGHLGRNVGHLGRNVGHLGRNVGHLGRNLGHLGRNVGHLGRNFPHLGRTMYSHVATAPYFQWRKTPAAENRGGYA